MYGKYSVKIKGDKEIVKKSNEQMSSMTEVFNWYSQTVHPNPANLPEQCFEKGEREWRLIRPVGDCEIVVLELID